MYMVGNIPNYNKFDVLRVFLLIEVGSSRAEMTNKLSLGEGTVRTILNSLKKKGLITSSKQGHELTKKGLELKKGVYKEVGELKSLELKELNLLSKKGAVVKRFNTKMKNIDLRDIAIKNNADGALILRYDKELRLPNSEVDFSKDFRKSYEEIIRTFDVKPHNVVVVVFAKSQNQATNALLAIIVEMNTKIKGILESLIN